MGFNNLFRRGGAARLPRQIKVADDEPHQIVEINGNQFVSNLFWYQLSDITRYMAEARAWGDSHGHDIVTIRRSSRIQAGFVKKGSAAMKGMYSIASALAALLGDSWCGAFALRDGRYAVVAMHDSMVAPGFDLITNEAHAVRKLNDAIQLFNIPEASIFAPRGFGLANNERDIYELLRPQALNKTLRLQPLRFGMTKREIAVIGGGVAAASMLLGGFWLYERHMEAVAKTAADEAELKSIADLARINLLARKKLMADALKHPWSRLPTVSDFARVCESATNVLPLSIAGWVFSSSECTNTKLTITYTRKAPATQEAFFRMAQASGRSTPAFSDPDTGAFSIPLVMPAGGDDDVIDAGVLSRKFFSYFQSTNLDGISIKTEPVLAKIDIPQLPGSHATGPARTIDASWLQYSYTIGSVPIQPSTLLVGLGTQSGMRVTSITSKLAQDTAVLSWTIQGNLYAKK